MTLNPTQRTLLTLVMAGLLATGVPARAETASDTISGLGTYLAARLAQDLRDTGAANVLLKAALERDPANPKLLEQAFISEVMGGTWPKAVAYAARAVTADPANHLAHFVLGDDAFKSGRLGEAEKHFAEPGNTPIAVMARAWVLNARKDSKAANALLDGIADPNWIAFFRRYQSAQLADVNGDSGAASKVYEDLFRADPATINVALSYARHASHGGDGKLATDILAKHAAAARSRHPFVEAANEALARGDKLALTTQTNSEGLAGVFYGFSQAINGQGGVDLALIYCQLALQLKPDDQLSQTQLAAIYEQLKQYDNAIAIYNRLPSDSPLHFDASLRAGLNLNALDKPAEAKAALKAIAEPVLTDAMNAGKLRASLHSDVEVLAGLSLHEKGARVLTLQRLLGRAGYADGGNDGNFGNATRDAVAKLQKDAGLPDSGQLDAPTRKALEDKIAAQPVPAAKPLDAGKLIDVYQTLGNMLRGRKEFAEAAEYYSKALALIPKPGKDNWDQFYSRAVCFERLNDWPKAEADFLKAMELNPDEPLILNYLGYSWVDRNEHVDKALELIKKAVSLKPEDGYYVDSLGWAYFRMGKYEDAVQQLEHAVELKAEDPVINDHLGDAYWRAGRKLEAQFQWSTSLISKPEAADIPKLRDKMKNGLPAEPAAASAANAATVKPADPAAKDKPKQP